MLFRKHNLDVSPMEIRPGQARPEPVLGLSKYSCPRLFVLRTHRSPGLQGTFALDFEVVDTGCG